MHHRTTFARAGAIAGIAFFVLMAVRVIVSPDIGTPDDPSTVVADKVAAHSQGVLVDAYAGGVATVLLLVFATGLCSALVRAGAAREPVALAYAGAVSAFALASLSHVLTAALAYGAPRASADAATTQALFDLAKMADTVTWFGLAAFVGSASLAALRLRVLSRGAAYGGLAIAAVCLLAAGGMARHGVFAVEGAFQVLALLGVVAWVLAAGIRLLRAPRRAALVPAPARV